MIMRIKCAIVWNDLLWNITSELIIDNNPIENYHFLLVFLNDKNENVKVALTRRYSIRSLCMCVCFGLPRTEEKRSPCFSLYHSFVFLCMPSKLWFILCIIKSIYHTSEYFYSIFPCTKASIPFFLPRSFKQTDLQALVITHIWFYSLLFLRFFFTQIVIYQQLWQLLAHSPRVNILTIR